MKRWFNLIGLCLLLAGCGQSKEQAMLDELYPDRKPVFPVSGVVTVDGQPTKDLFVRLVPAADNKPSADNPQSFTKEDGSFSFSTYLDGDGVHAGKYKVLIEQLVSQGQSIWTGPDGLKNRYNHLDAPALEIDVSEQALDDLKIELTLSGQNGKKPPSYGVTQLGNQSRMKRGR